MAVPKYKTSKSRRNKRRTHQKLKKAHFDSCPKCHEAYQRHHICPSCGYYKGTEVLSVEEI